MNIYFYTDEPIKFNIGNILSTQYAKVRFVVTKDGKTTTVHTSNALPKGQDYYEWTVTDAEKELILSNIHPTVRSVDGRMYVDVFWAATGWEASLFNENYDMLFVLDETEATKPSLTTVSIEPSDYGVFVQSCTKLIYSLKAEAKCGATIKTFTAKANDLECTLIDEGDGNYRFESDWLVYSGTYTISITIKDSRGFSRSLTDEIYVHSYIPPVITPLSSENGLVLQRWRPDTDTIDNYYGTECRVALGVYVSFIADIQTGYTVTYRYKLRGASEWSEYLPVGQQNRVDVTESGLTNFTAIITDGTYANENGVLTGKFDTNQEYSIEIRVVDDIGVIATRYELLRGQEVPFNINEDGDAVSVGKYATKRKWFDSAWSIHSDENIEAEKNIYAKQNIEASQDISVGAYLILRGIQLLASATELNYCQGLNANAQEQLDSKAKKNHYHYSSDISHGSQDLDDYLYSLSSTVSSLVGDVSELKNKLN